MSVSRVYPGTVVRVVDGDTVLLTIDLGFHINTRLSCRLIGMNAIEMSQPGGPEARDHLAALLPAGTELLVMSVSADKFSGRFLGRIPLPDGRDAADVMIADGFAARWDGEGKRATPLWPRPTQTAK